MVKEVHPVCVSQDLATECIAHPILREGGTNHGPLVFLLDPLENRRARIHQIVKATAQNVIISEGGYSPLSAARSSSVIAIVSVGPQRLRNEKDLETIERFRAHGAFVIAFEDGSNQWSVGSKCRPLLAGAVHLLDSATAGFSDDLQRVLRKGWQEFDTLDAENRKIALLMCTHGIAGSSPALTDAFRQALRFSQWSELPVLISGESGTGKELLANAIAKLDPKRKAGPFLPVNCAAINPTVLESELFGHRRGAFTGAERDRKGWIRSAEGGVLFLDEIGEMDLAVQPKLLRVLQEKRVLSVGEDREVPVDVRFVAATNRNLERLVAEGKFRADLFHRLRVLTIRMPSLRERSSDLPLLVQYILSQYNYTHPNHACGVTQDYLDAIRQMDLPGNVRQLRNIVQQSIISHCGPGEVDLNDLPADALRQLTDRIDEDLISARNGVGPNLASAVRTPDINELVRRILDTERGTLTEMMRECERHVFHVTLSQTKGNQSEAARLLGVTPRSVYNKMRKYRLSF